MLAPVRALRAEEPKVEDLRAGGNDDQRFFLMSDPKGDAPRKGYGLVVVLPGGTGDANFRPFVENMYRQAVPKGFLLAQMVSKKWTPDQQVIWPTSKVRATSMDFTTEEFFEAVVRDVRKRHKIDRSRIYTLSWSSGGPAAYAISLTSSNVTGSLVAMSVFRREWMPKLDAARGHAYFLLQSPQDEITAFSHAEKALEELKRARAKVELLTYEGGHGWHGDVFGNLRTGFAWLEKNHGKPRKK